MQTKLKKHRKGNSLEGDFGCNRLQNEEIFTEAEMEEVSKEEAQFQQFKNSNASARGKRKRTELFKKRSIYQYLAAVLVMSLKSLPDYTMHWCKDKWYSTEIMCNIISRDEFKKMHRYIHFDLEEFQKLFNAVAKKIYIPANFKSGSN